MALSNAEKQARWRERHIGKRRNAQRIVNLLVRKHLADEHVIALAELLNMFFNRDGVRILRRRLKELAEERPGSAYDRAQNKKATDDERHVRDWWLREHPGKTVKDYRRVPQGEMEEWRQAKNRDALAVERLAWERDHPGKEFPEHMCGLTDREYTDYARWKRQWHKRRRRRDERKERPAVT